MCVNTAEIVPWSGKRIQCLLDFRLIRLFSCSVLTHRHTDFCTARPARLDASLALNLPLLITDKKTFSSALQVCKESYDSLVILQGVAAWNRQQFNGLCHEPGRPK